LPCPSSQTGLFNADSATREATGFLTISTAHCVAWTIQSHPLQAMPMQFPGQGTARAARLLPAMSRLRSRHLL
jgi:hypothetical protein